MIRNVSTNYKIVKNILNKGFYFETSFFAKPKDGSKGEDAFAYNKTMMCVADGVGGWNHQGVDPSKYSSALITNYQKLYNKTQSVQFTYNTKSSTGVLVTVHTLRVLQ